MRRFGPMDSGTISLFRNAGLFLGLCLTGCQSQAEDIGKAPTSSAVVSGATNSVAKKPPLASASNNEAVPPPPGGATNAEKCPATPSRYELTIEGDGAVQHLKDGAPHVPWQVRGCEPDVHTRNGETIFGGCADSRDIYRSCFWGSKENAVYFDREGTLWHLNVLSGSVTQQGAVYQGEFTLGATTSKVRGKRQSKPSRPLELRVHVRVGSNVVVVPAPEMSETDGEGLHE